MESNIYIVHGSESYLQKEFYNKLKQKASQEGLIDWNWTVLNGSKELTDKQILEELVTTPWGDGRKYIIIRQCEQILAAVWDKILLWLKEHDTQNCLVMFFTKIDRRVKAIKSFLKMGKEVSCEHLKSESLIRWIQDYCQMEEKSIQREAVLNLIDRVGEDLFQIKNELDKLFLYVVDNKITNEDVTAIVSIVPGQLEQGVIFKLVDAIAAKKSFEAIKILHLLLNAGEPPLRILPMIERQLRLLLAAKTSESLPLAEIAKLIGESSDYPLKKVKSHASKFSMEELYDSFHKIVITDSELKLSAEGELTLEKLIHQLCS